MKACAVTDCSSEVGGPRHYLCLAHWKGMKDGKVQKCAGCGSWFDGTNGSCATCSTAEPTSGASDTRPSQWLTATAIGRHFGNSASRMNLVFAELGWIEKGPKGWLSTDSGRKQGARDREDHRSGVPYVTWPLETTENRILLTTIRDVKGEEEAPAPEKTEGAGQDFRDKFPAKYRATDGHLVRSRAEMLIDNWLYMSGIVHAVERKLPIEEDVYCDFYIPSKKVYLEFWGMEGQPSYDERKEKKLAIYQRYGFSLIELGDEEIANLDDILPRKLLKFGVVVD